MPYTIPICVGFLFLGMSYGFLMRSKGFSFVYPMLMSFFIFAGSMEFVVYCLKDAVSTPLHGLPELIAIIFISVLYMVLVQTVK